MCNLQSLQKAFSYVLLVVRIILDSLFISTLPDDASVPPTDPQALPQEEKLLNLHVLQVCWPAGDAVPSL